MISYRLIASMAVFLAACSYPGPNKPEAQMALRKRASFDLHCSEKDVELQQLSGTCADNAANNCVYGVTCGENRAAYLYFGNNTWLLNSDSSSGKSK